MANEDWMEKNGRLDEKRSEPADAIGIEVESFHD